MGRTSGLCNGAGRLRPRNGRCEAKKDATSCRCAALLHGEFMMLCAAGAIGAERRVLSVRKDSDSV